MAEEKKTEVKEKLKLEFKKSKFLTKYSGNGVTASDGEFIEVSPALAEQILYNLPENMTLISKSKVADEVWAKVKEKYAVRSKRQKAAQKEIDDKLKTQEAKNKAAFNK